MEKDKIRFGFEYETLIEVTPAYNEMMEQVVQLQESGKFNEMCNGLLAKTVYDEKEILELEKEAKKNGDPYAMEFVEVMRLGDEADPNVLKNVLLASLYNGTLPREAKFRSTRFQVGDKTRKPCDVFPSSVKDRKVYSYDASTVNHDTDRNSRIWAVTHDSSVFQDGEVPLYHNFKDTFMSEPSSPPPDANELLKYTEVVSPILSLADFTSGYFQTICGKTMTVHDMMKYWNCSRTSNHIHMSYESPLFHQYKPQVLVKVCMAWLYFEPVIMLLMGHWRRNNQYCEMMRKKLGSKVQTGKVPEFFMNMTSDNYMKYLGPLLDGIPADLEDPVGRQNVVNAIIHFFQGPIDKRETRYAALNLMNLRQDGIQTVEFRIKQGSADIEENVMFMKFLAEFVHSAITGPDIVTRIGHILKVRAWTIYDQLAPHWGQFTRVSLDNKQKMMVDTIFQELMTLIEDIQVKTYFMKMYRAICYKATSSGGAMHSMSMSVDKSRSKTKSNTRRSPERHQEWTSWGLVDYDQMCDAAAKDPVVKKLNQNMAKYQHLLYRPTEAVEQPSARATQFMTKTSNYQPMVSVYGGKKKKTTNKKE